MSDIVHPKLPRLKAGQVVRTPIGDRPVAWQSGDKVTVIDAVHIRSLKTYHTYKDFNRREVTLVT